MIYLDQLETCELCAALVLKENVDKHKAFCLNLDGWLERLIDRYFQY